MNMINLVTMDMAAMNSTRDMQGIFLPPGMGSQGQPTEACSAMEAAASTHGATVFLRDCQRASGAAKAAWLQAQSGALQNCHEILPAYLRLSQAERMRKERMEQ